MGNREENLWESREKEAAVSRNAKYTILLTVHNTQGKQAGGQHRERNTEVAEKTGDVQMRTKAERGKKKSSTYLLRRPKNPEAVERRAKDKDQQTT